MRHGDNTSPNNGDLYQINYPSVHHTDLQKVLNNAVHTFDNNTVFEISSYKISFCLARTISLVQRGQMNTGQKHQTDKRLGNIVFNKST